MGTAGILERIDQRLAALGYTDNRASQLAGHPDAIRNMRRALERGGAGPSPKVLHNLAKALECSTAWLMGEPTAIPGDPPGLAILRSRRRQILRELESLDQSIELIQGTLLDEAPEEQKQKKR